MDYDVIPYPVLAALMHFGLVFGTCLGIAAIVSLAISVVGHGPIRGFKHWGTQIITGIIDFSDTSLRRVWAIASLTIREAIRRKALVVFVIFAVLFMFAGWFLPESNEEQPALLVKGHVSFVLRAITWLILPVILLLSCWGIPEDIRLRSMHTVVTKPARRSEIVMGRILGFSCVGTLVVAVMGIVGYLWLIRTLPEDVRNKQLVCRVPVYGALSFLSREGNATNKGINTGDIWNFRSYIEGGTKAAAIWNINGVSESVLTPVEDTSTGEVAPGLQLETRFEAFRSHKGVIGRGLLAQIRFINEEKNLRVPIPAFEIAEYRGNLVGIPRKINYFDEEAKASKTVDLLDELTVDGSLRIEVQCLNSGQYLGMARPDLFIRTPDRNFLIGYLKATLGIWLMMLLLATLGVTTSCFVKGPVATLFTFSILVVGHWLRELMEKIVSGQNQGGGPFESIYRMITHMNQVVELDEAWWVWPVRLIDRVSIEFLWLSQQVIPNFDYYNMSPYLANGFDVNFNAAMLPSIMITAAYMFPCLLIGYYSLKLRELEAK